MCNDIMQVCKANAVAYDYDQQCQSGLETRRRSTPVIFYSDVQYTDTQNTDTNHVAKTPTFMICVADFRDLCPRQSPRTLFVKNISTCQDGLCSRLP